MAVILSGLPVHGFTFRGFPPHKPGPRRRFLEVDRNSPHTLIFYESPHRLKAFLADAPGGLGDREAAVANDLTKISKPSTAAHCPTSRAISSRRSRAEGPRWSSPGRRKRRRGHAGRESRSGRRMSKGRRTGPHPGPSPNNGERGASNRLPCLSPNSRERGA